MITNFAIALSINLRSFELLQFHTLRGKHHFKVHETKINYELIEQMERIERMELIKMIERMEKGCQKSISKICIRAARAHFDWLEQKQGALID